MTHCAYQGVFCHFGWDRARNTFYAALGESAKEPSPDGRFCGVRFSEYSELDGFLTAFRRNHPDIWLPPRIIGSLREDFQTLPGKIFWLRPGEKILS
jgi:hypothetical protein